MRPARAISDHSVLKVNKMQRSGTEAIRTQNPARKTKTEIHITNSQSTKRTYDQPS